MGFATLYALRLHATVHTGLKPFKFIMCDKAFRVKSQCNWHMKKSHVIVDGQFDFKCNTCDRGFSKLAYLRSHERTHAGEKAYDCVKCGAVFLDKICSYSS